MAYEQRQYTESDAVKKWREQMEAQAGLKPQDYQSRYQAQIDQTVDQILNRKPFQYDVNGDALYQQYKDRYVNLGQQAMMDTMGQAAKLTGGYGNSYAQMAGQQAYQGYLQGLTDKIPELAQLAQNQYNQQGQDLYQRYGLLNTQDQGAYDRWMNEYSRWLSERDYLSGRYDTERGYDYGQFRDTVGDDQWKAQFDEDLRRFNFANKLGEFAPAPVVYSGGGGGGETYGGPDDGNWPVGIDTTRNQNGLKGSSWDYTKNNLSQLVNSGNVAAVDKYMTQISKELNEDQYKQAINIIEKKK
jgi:hypothetical protein